MSKIFKSVQMKRPGRARFDLSHDVKMTGNMGTLYPSLCMEVIPGDHIKLGCDVLTRLAPMVAPMMHRVDVRTEYFFVPYRLLWANWEKYITDGNGTGIGLPAVPYVSLDPALSGPGTLVDYLGIGFGGGATVHEKVQAAPFFAYQLIWNEYFRDQNMQAPLSFTTLVDGDNSGYFFSGLGDLRQRCWEHDPFTAALPFAQKGAAVSLPLGDVVAKPLPFDVADNPAFRSMVDKTVGGTTSFAAVEQQVVVPPITGQVKIGGTGDAMFYDPNGTLEVSPTTINDLRTAFRLQEFLERQARGGTRYTEIIRAHFGVMSKDSRLQRPEYICGTKTPIGISEVLNTTGTATAPQGNMAGHGLSANGGNYGDYYATEHGFIMGLVSVMPKTSYFQGIPKMFSKINSIYEHFWPEFAHLGEQEVKQSEIFAGTAGDNVTFGYLPRYWEYRELINRVAGDFKTSLKFWHMARDFGSAAPSLNADFVESDPTTRVFAVDDPAVHHVWMDVIHKILAVRPMPYFANPHM